MGQIKAIWGKGLEAIEKKMDEITAEYGHVLSAYDYWDCLQDYFEIDFLQDYKAAILEHAEFLEWQAENEKAAAK